MLDIRPPTDFDRDVQFVAVYAAPWSKHGIAYGPVRSTRREIDVGNPIYRLKITWKRNTPAYLRCRPYAWPAIPACHR